MAQNEIQAPRQGWEIPAGGGEHEGESEPQPVQGPSHRPVARDQAQTGQAGRGAGNAPSPRPRPQTPCLSLSVRPPSGPLGPWAASPSYSRRPDADARVHWPRWGIFSAIPAPGGCGSRTQASTSTPQSCLPSGDTSRLSHRCPRPRHRPCLQSPLEETSPNGAM